MREPPYFIGYGKIRLNIHRIVTGKYFDLIIALVIGLNVITMSLEHYMMPMVFIYLFVFQYHFYHYHFNSFRNWNLLSNYSISYLPVFLLLKQ